MKNIARLYAAALALMLPLSAMAAEGENSLYQRLGGSPVVSRIVEETIEAVARDSRVNQSFDKVDRKKLNQKIVEQICALAGGGCRYTGDDMKKVHAGLDITEHGFYAMVAALRIALEANGVGEREKNELLRLLAPMKRDVVTR